MPKDSFISIQNEQYFESFYVPREATIVRSEALTEKERFFEIELDDGKPLGHSPGQFVVLSLFGYGQAAISVCSSPTKSRRNSFDVCVRRVGVFTTALHNLQAGDKIGVLGPFGIPFPVDEMKGSDLLIVAGGLGIIPLRSLINFVIDCRRDFGKINILLGCKSPGDRLFIQEIETWETMSDIGYACTVDRAAPDWQGNVGVITSLIPGVDIDPMRTYAVIVGPPVMYKFVIKELKSKGIEDRQIILSLERRMRCGVGRCGHCQMNNLYVCKDGPTFRYDQIKGLEEAL